MFPSFGLFSAAACPLFKYGFCKRPYCLFKHTPEDALGASNKLPRSDFTGVQNGSSSAVCGSFQELERLDKEIETVKHEVEEEQKRLSLYQTEQTDSKNTAQKYSTTLKSPRVCKNAEGLYSQQSCTSLSETDSGARKYVVDNSKPRTDLEYDPLSNFSANLRSYSSSGKMKSRQSLKRTRDVVCDDKNKPPACQARHPQTSPDLLDDSNEDCVLIIDIPHSPDKKRAQFDKPLNAMGELKDKSVEMLAVDDKLPSKLAEINGSVGLDKSLTDALRWKPQKATCVQLEEMVAVKNPELGAGVPASRDSPEFNLVIEEEGYTLNVEMAQCEILCSAKKVSPVQQTLAPNKSPAVNSLCSGTQHTVQTLKKEQSTLNTGTSNWSTAQDAQSGLALQQESRKLQSKSAVFPTKPHGCVAGAESGSCSAASSMEHLADDAGLLAAVSEEKAENVIIIDSSSEEDLNCHDSDLEMSESDTMEECYRIFMEANAENNSAEQANVSESTVTVDPWEERVKPQPLTAKKRVAHEVKHTELLARKRTQPQVLVPLCSQSVQGLAPQPSVPTRIQQIQQSASMYTAAVKSGQAVSASLQKKQEARAVIAPQCQPSVSKPTPLTKAYVNYIPLGTAVIGVGNNVHLILPEGAFPLPATSSSASVASVLSPISQVHMNPVSSKQTHYPPALSTVHRSHTTPPLIIPALARKPAVSVVALAHSQPAPPTAPPQAPQTATKLQNKQKMKRQQSEATKDKVPRDIRQRYVNMFTEEFLKTATSVKDAFEKALTEERTVYNRSINKLKYLSAAVNALKRLKSQSVTAAKDESDIKGERSKGCVPLNVKKLKRSGDVALFESLKDYILTEEMLIENNYPLQHPEKPAAAVLFIDNKGNTDPHKRICCRCGATYSVSQTGKHIRKEECNYHYGKGVENRVPGGVETRYSCCQGVMGTPGCQVFKLHVHDSFNMGGFVSTRTRDSSDTTCPGVYAIDCEMCYTIQGLELSRVSVVNSSLNVVYDTFVQPSNEVIDYNTRFSGICEEDMMGNHVSLREVQETLLTFINADTVLIGHGLEADLCVLKLLHKTVVDTSVVFPHRMGPPYKLTLNSLTADYLRKIIQESVCGHDTAEDAAACMELMLWKLKEDGKLKK
ncbi:RNA exonuclease 1 homolog [Thalassophryne amazonica]|uniref:RNA exonuclease 1 homolog n=1 Tax=Thalassophryne amazonica TaxID=390379 RepID=UPI001471D8FB|nr:RNA exonuclease 1 homolog [Thalassophryne amazonica]